MYVLPTHYTEIYSKREGEGKINFLWSLPVPRRALQITTQTFRIVSQCVFFTYIDKHLHTYTRTHGHKCTYMYTHGHTYAHVYTYTSTQYTHTRTVMRIHTRSHRYTCAYVPTRAQGCTHAHTRTDTYESTCDLVGLRET